MDGQVIRAAVGEFAAAAAAAAIMIPLPGKLLRICCNSFRIPSESSVVDDWNSMLRPSSKRSSGTEELDLVGVEVVEGVGDAVGVSSVVEDSRIFDMYFMYQSSILLILDVVVLCFVRGLDVTAKVVVVVAAKSVGPGKSGRLTRTVFKKEV